MSAGLLILPALHCRANILANGGFELTGGRVQVHTNVPADPDTVGLWKLDEGSGASTADGSANGNNGTISGATWTNDSASVNALWFDGDDLVSTGNDTKTDHEFSGTSFSLEAWFRADPAWPNWASIITKYGGFHLRKYSTGHKLSFTTYGILSGTSAELLSVNNMNDNIWHHVLAVYDKAAQKKYLFIDGVNSVAPLAVSGTLTTTPTRTTKIGCADNGQYFKGALDEIKISDVARVCPANWSVDNLNGTLYQATDFAHSNTYSLKMNPLAGAGTEFSTRSDAVAVTNGASYDVSGWIRTDPDYNGSVEPQIVVQSGSQATTITGGGAETHGTWRRYTGRIVAEGTTLTVALKAFGTEGSAWFDDISVIQRPHPGGSLISIR